MAEYIVEVAAGVDPARVRAALTERRIRVKAALIASTSGRRPDTGARR
jgi:hypothetical protein